MKRLLILGFAYSGSTLLSLGLSRSPEVCALGEVPLMPVRAPRLPCTCGVTFARCPVWGPLFAQGEGSATLSLERILAALPSYVRAVDPQVQWYVDSGKTQHGGLLAHLALGLEDLRVVHLVRHPAAVSYSCMARGMSLDEALALWLAMERRTTDWVERAEVPVLRVRFEEMTADFAGTLSEVGRFLGVKGPGNETLEPWDWQGCEWSGRAHLMGSNSNVKFGGRPSAVRVDERYRSALPAYVIAHAEARAGSLWSAPGGAR